MVSDPYTNQMMGYATVAGVNWVVLTDGDEYRVTTSMPGCPWRTNCSSGSVSPTDPGLDDGHVAGATFPLPSEGGSWCQAMRSEAPVEGA